MACVPQVFREDKSLRCEARESNLAGRGRSRQWRTVHRRRDGRIRERFLLPRSMDSFSLFNSEWCQLRVRPPLFETASAPRVPG